MPESNLSFSPALSQELFRVIINSNSTVNIWSGENGRMVDFGADIYDICNEVGFWIMARYVNPKMPLAITT